MKKLNIIFSSFPDFSGNSKALYEYMTKRYKNQMNLVWIIRNKEVKKILDKKGIDNVLDGSNEWKKLLDKGNIIFDTHGSLFSQKKKGQYYFNLWHGVGPKKGGYFIDKDLLSQNDYDFLKEAEKKIDYIIAPSELWRSVFSSMFNVEVNRVLPLGMPRCDYLFRSQGKDNLKLLTNIDVGSYKKIIFYLPTFRKGCGRDKDGFLNLMNILSLNNYNEEDLLKFLNKENYLLVIKLHPSEESAVKKVEHPNIVYLSEDLMVEENITIYELLNCADVLITDYSSVYTEYLLLSKPVLFIHSDINKYVKNRGFAFNTVDFWFPGPRVSIIENFMKELNDLINNPDYYKDERRVFLDLMFENKKGNYCKAICDYIFDNNSISKKCTLNIDIEEELKEELLVKKEEIDEKNNQILVLKDESEKKSNELTYEINRKTSELNELQNRIDMIENSKSWKILSFIRKIKNKVLFVKKNK